MKRNIYLIFSLLVIFTFSSCEDLEVENTTRPTKLETLDPVQVGGVVSGLFNSWYLTAVEYNGPGLATFMTSDVGSCSWGNAGMRDLSSEPRVAFNNTPSYPSMVHFESYYKGMYSTLNIANDALNTIANAGDVTVPNKEMNQAGAYFMQGVTLGAIGLMFDQGFVVTDETDLGAEVPVVGYEEVITAAIASLDKCIALCESNTFTVPATWFPVATAYTNAEFGALANTMAARLLTYKSRTAAQNAANDWATIRDYALKGISMDFEIIMDDINWYNLLVTYAVYGGWGRIDMRTINMMDPNMPPWFPASGNVADLPNSGLATSNDARLAADFEYMSGQDFPAERGIYHFTTYRYQRHDQYLTTWTEPLAYVRKTENDMILAEAYVRTGNLAAAAAILNDASNSRKARGGLADVAANEADLLEAIAYEKTIECILTGENVEFYDMRRRDMLQEGTLLHFPIVAQQLEVMLMDFYTFGGTTGQPGVDYSTGGWEVGSNRPVY